MPMPLDICRTPDVLSYALDVFRDLYPEKTPKHIEQGFNLIERYFQGKVPEYQPIDLIFHDFEHTLRGAVATITFAQGLHRNHPAKHIFPAEAFEIVVLSILMHDTGYLKETHDQEGTGAKYTADHVERSCRFAERVLTSLGFGSQEIAMSRNMILCTGLQLNTKEIHFVNDADRWFGYCIGAGDLLGQMADPRYLGKLPALYQEFREAQAAEPEKWTWGTYSTYSELLSKTPWFYKNYVLPTIENQLGNVHTYSNFPFGSNDNIYLKAIERNIADIEEILTKSGDTSQHLPVAKL